MNTIQLNDDKVYYRLQDIPGYSKEKINKTFFYAKIDNYMNLGRTVYIRCTKQQAYDYRNLQRDTQRKENSYNKHIASFTESIDESIFDGEEYIFSEYEDKDTIGPEEITVRQLLIKEIMDKIKNEDMLDKQIVSLILDGYTSVTEISKQIGIPRTTVQYHMDKLRKIYKYLK